MRSVTKQGIREARLKEIKEELLHSEKLKVRRARAGLASRGAASEQAGRAFLAASLSQRWEDLSLHHRERPTDREGAVWDSAE